MEIVILVLVLAVFGGGIWFFARRRSDAARVVGSQEALADRLSTGEAGIMWEVPSTWRIETSNSFLLEYVDEAKAQLWSVSFSPFGLDLGEQHFDLLRQDIERQAREKFESDTPRTRQEGWSPVVSVQAVEVDSTLAVETIYRLTYEPGNEVVVGQLMVPLAQGFAAINVMAKAAITGVRETALAMAAMMGNDPDDGSWPEVTQEQIDDPELDDGGLNPVSVVRGALRWLRSTDGAALTVTLPAEQALSPLALDGSQCSIVPPPRYVQVADDFPRSETMDVLTRVGLGSEGVRLIDVYKVPDRTLDSADLGGLEQLARENAKEWSSEGVNDISCEIRPIEMDDGRTHAGNHIQLSVHGTPSHTFAHWFIDHDGVVYRVGAGGPPHIPVGELAADARHVVETFQRQDAAG